MEEGDDSTSIPSRTMSLPVTSNHRAPAPPAAAPPGAGPGKWVWVPYSNRRGMSFRIPMADYIQRSLSRSSSHFCDLDDDDQDEQSGSARIEEGEDGGDDDDDPPPPQPKPKDYSRLSIILLDQGLFTVYKRLFLLSLTLNLILINLAISGDFQYGRHNPSLFAVGNLLAVVLCRSEAFFRLLFWLAVNLLGHPWIPLPIKTATTAFLQSVGGIHSSCGISSVGWLIYALVRSLKHRHNTTTHTIAITSAILFLLLICCLSAFPLLRHLHHNVFERTHRYSGWAALALLWSYLVTTTRSHRLVREQEFWLTVVITVAIILPWLTIRRVPVTATAPSGHASIIKFAGGVKPGILGRISRSPLSEWHAFGIISDGESTHMMLAGAVGDFTKVLVTDLPSHLWVRGVHFAGLPYLTNMYSRVCLMATGSGICVFLSFLLQPCRADVCLVWVTKGVEANFGAEIKEWMCGQHEKDKVIVHDTAVSGRPNVAELTISAARKWKAEVVIVTSNPQGSRDVVNACKDAGFAAFGPIWDS